MTSAADSNLQRAGFYADFILCPLGITALLAYAWMLGPALESGVFVGACLVGAAAWTLAEYLIHRFFLHGVPMLRCLHLRHHAAPRALIGTPAWLSPLLAVTLFAATHFLADATLASGTTVGVTLGYLFYACIHYAAHHLPSLRWRWLRRLRCAHALHHSSPTACNFGVSSGLWDRVFGTDEAGASPFAFSERSRAVDRQDRGVARRQHPGRERPRCRGVLRHRSAPPASHPRRCRFASKRHPRRVWVSRAT